MLFAKKNVRSSQQNNGRVMCTVYLKKKKKIFSAQRIVNFEQTGPDL